MKFLVGLTGGIGSGKSSAGRLFEEHGIDVIDADAISRALTAPGGGAMPQIRASFGEEFVDSSGALDRARMRAAAFGDPAVRARLEAILHPLIRAETDRRIALSSAPYVVLMIPLLVESGAPKRRCHRVVVVDVPEAVQLARVMQRDGLSCAEAEAILRAQASREERLRHADDVIDNSGPEEALSPQVNRLHEKYVRLALARAWPPPDAMKNG